MRWSHCMRIILLSLSSYQKEKELWRTGGFIEWSKKNASQLRYKARLVVKVVSEHSRIDKLKKHLNKSFSMKDLGPAKKIFGIRLTTSNLGYLTVVGRNLVTWRSKKQPVITRSRDEVEYKGRTFGVCELLWFKILLKDLGFKPKVAMNHVNYRNCSHVKIDKTFYQRNT